MKTLSRCVVSTDGVGDWMKITLTGTRPYGVHACNQYRLSLPVTECMYSDGHGKAEARRWPYAVNTDEIATAI